MRNLSSRLFNFDFDRMIFIGVFIHSFFETPVSAADSWVAPRMAPLAVGALHDGARPFVEARDASMRSAEVGRGAGWGVVLGALGAGPFGGLPAVGPPTAVWRQSRAISSWAVRRLTDPEQTASWSRFSIPSFS